MILNQTKTMEPMMNRCFFPGSFDPFTFGHKNIIEKASVVSEHIIIGIGQHHEKKSLININTRESLLNESIKSIEAPNTKIDVIELFLKKPLAKHLT